MPLSYLILTLNPRIDHGVPALASCAMDLEYRVSTSRNAGVPMPTLRWPSPQLHGLTALENVLGGPVARDAGWMTCWMTDGITK